MCPLILKPLGTEIALLNCVRNEYAYLFTDKISKWGFLWIFSGLKKIMRKPSERQAK